MVENLAANAGDVGLIPGVRKIPWRRKWQPMEIPWTEEPATATAKSLQSCPTLCDPIDGSLLGSSVHGIFQARVLEWVAIAFSR